MPQERYSSSNFEAPPLIAKSADVFTECHDERKFTNPATKKQKVCTVDINDCNHRTESFPPIWTGSYCQNILSLNHLRTSDDPIENIEPHTLILGTHPSITSLHQQQYYGHPMNAFWWIAGDCLGFRRDSGFSKEKTGIGKNHSEKRRYKFTEHVRHEGPIITYNEQMKQLITKGFALWDVVKSCQRQGSLDQNINNELPNDIRRFCDEHKSIRRIVLSNGQSTLKLFCKHFKDWLETGQLCIPDTIVGNDNQGKQGALRLSAKLNRALCATDGVKGIGQRILLIPALSVSPAAARYTYQEKRDFWAKHVYEPGLADYHCSQKNEKQTR